MKGILFVAGIMITSMVLLHIRDRRFFKRFRYSTPENEKLARSMSFTPLANFVDSVIITAVAVMCLMAYLQFTHQIP